MLIMSMYMKVLMRVREYVSKFIVCICEYVRVCVQVIVCTFECAHVLNVSAYVCIHK